MEDFDIDPNQEIGTSVSKIKNTTETDIDYDKILDSLQNSETLKTISKDVNIGQFVKNVELDLDKMNSNNISINLSQDNIKPENKNMEVNTQNVFDNFKHRDIVLYVLIFMLLNNKFIIEIIYDRIPFMKNINSPYPNLIIRGLLFGVIIYFIKKFNL